MRFDLDKVFVGLDQLYNYPFGVKDYPRCNIGKSENGYKLEMALPGWKYSDVEVSFQDGVLTVSGSKEEVTEGLEWIHKGISEKSFERAFKVNSTLEVKGAKFEDGMLTVEMQYLPKTTAVKIPVEVPKGH